MKKLVTVLALAAMMTLGIGNAMAFTQFNPVLGPCTDEDFQQMAAGGTTVSHMPGLQNNIIGPTPDEMDAAYKNGNPVRPMLSFNPILGPCTEEDWNALKSNAGTAY